MTETREFPIEVVVTAITEIMLCELGSVYDVLSFLVGRSVFTHEIPGAIRECAEPVCERYPELRAKDGNV